MTQRRSPLDETRAARIREEHDLNAEFEAHLEHRVDDLVAKGLAREEARAQAMAEFGDPEQIKAESLAVRDKARRLAARSSSWEAARQDAKHAFRLLRNGPGFALTALVTLMLGVGATVTIASVVQAVVIEPLPFEDPERVVFAEMLTPDAQRFSVAEAVYPDWRAQTRSFDEMAAMYTVGGTLRSPGQPRPISVGRVTHTLLAVLGVDPAVGRFFAPDEDLAGMASPVAVLSFDTWRADFGGDPNVVGTTLDLDGLTYEVVGVMPEGLEVLTHTTPVFVPLGPDPTLDRGDHYLDVVARLAAGATFAQANDELRSLQLRLSEQHSADLDWSTQLYDARDVLIGGTVVRAGWVLLVAAAVLLLMACVNVSNLLMVRATVRRTEMALRMALGASRGRLVRQLFTESALLAAGGSALGILLTASALPAVKAIGEARIPRLDAAELNGSALAVGIAAAVLATLACGVAPVVQLGGDGLAGTVGTSRGKGADPGRRIRAVLVTAQVSLTVVLLSGTGLLLRSFMELSAVDPGFEAEGTLAFRIEMPDGAYSWEERGELFPTIREAVASVPAVVASGATAVDPFSGSSLANFVAPSDNVPDRAADFTPIHWRIVTPGFFEAMGMELIAGRTFEERDTWEDDMPILIGASLAEATWGSQNPIGRQMVWGDPEGSRLTVVGVVEDLRDVVLDQDPLPIVYRSYQSVPWAVMTMVTRVDGDPTSVVPAIRARLQEAVPGLPLGEFRSLEENLRWALAEPRFNLQLLSGFALIGLLMAVIGVYGITAFDVRRRMPEIGIRLSLGAEPRGIRSMILRQRMATTLLGVVIGLALAGALSQVVRSLLYEITPSDPATWLGVTAVIVGSSLLATYLPARRATKVDPSIVLNAE